jgi:hypothetical protein
VNKLLWPVLLLDEGTDGETASELAFDRLGVFALSGLNDCRARKVPCLRRSEYLYRANTKPLLPPALAVITDAVGRWLAFGRYPALHKLENEGLLESYEGSEKGRKRRYYQITESGRGVLAKEREEWQKVSRAVSLILEGA